MAGLSPQVFQILLSLVDAPLHGYAVIQDINTRTKGEIRLTASTLYDALLRLVEQGLIKEVDTPPDVSDHDARRRYYDLTRAGREAVKDEVGRLERLLQMAREKRLRPASARGRR
jgi:DNA-binding PadR family transcriptional regulator